MNLPNKLSILRIALIPLMVTLMYLPYASCWIMAMAVFALAALTDFLDGYIARKNQIVTDFGKFIDPVADKLLVLSALMMLCHRDMMEVWVVIVILARELCVDGLRMVAVGKGKVIAAGDLGKIKTVSQIILVLWQMLHFRPIFTMQHGVHNVLGILLTVWVLTITLWSGIDYFVKYGKYLTDTK